MGTALVTGASAGIGRAFALELAARGHDLVLVARDGVRLRALAAELAGVRVEVLPADLADREQLERVADRLRDADRPVELLVNNAGFGQGEAFLDNEIGAEEQALDVMVRAVMVLSHAAGRSMRERSHGGILNVSSFAGFVSMSAYSALKSWVTAFSESLATELAGTGVRVAATCPWFTHSEFHERAGLAMNRLPEALWLSAEEVVLDALRALDSGRVVTVPGAAPKVARAVVGVVPRDAVRRGSARVAAMRRRRG